MHALIHRALAPQTISSAWLVLTVALTFALAVAHSALASGPSLAAAGLPTARIALSVPARAPAPAPGTGRCASATPVEAPRAGAHRSAAARRAACGALGAPSWPGTAPILASSPHRTGAEALAVLFGGAGPHGPPAVGAIASFAGLFTLSLSLDSSLSLSRSAASAPSAAAVEVSLLIAGAPA